MRIYQDHINKFIFYSFFHDTFGIRTAHGMKILFINTHTDSKESIPKLAEDATLSVSYAQERGAASEHIQLYEYDCIVIQCLYSDAFLNEVLKEIYAKSSDTGIIVLSSELRVADKIRLLNDGVDDCLSIPYDAEELKARILAIIRRKKFNTRNNFIHIANVVIDISTQSVNVWDKPVVLTRTEYDLFIFLVMHKTATLPHTRFVDYLWGDSAEDKEASNLLITHIKNLRKKLKQAKAELEIKNVYAVGYTLIEL